MKRETTRVLTYLLLLLTWLAHSQQSCINRLNQKRDDTIENQNSLELITEIRSELNAEKRRVCRESNPETFLGSNLFDGIRKKCFSMEDISLITARSQFEMMIPVKMPPTLLTDKQISWIMHYFCYGHFLVDKLKDNNGNHIVKMAFYDTLGGFLHHYLIPIARASFYAGRIKVESVLKVIAHYQKCRRLLNTNGNGWRAPIADPLKHLHKGGVRQLNLKCSSMELPEESPSACAQLDLQSGATASDVVDDSMIVGLPRIELEDSDGYLGNMYLPFDRKRTFNLRSPKSVYVLVDFYKTVNACYEEKNKDPKVFNSKLRDWIVENVQPHLYDEMFYPGLGRVLNLYETLRHADEMPLLKKRSKKKKKISGDRMKRCKEDLKEALLQHRRKTLKFINLESKAKQVDFDCENNWLQDPLVTGVKLPRPKGCDEKKPTSTKKKSKWFGWFRSSEEKDGDKKKEKEEDDGSKKKSKWGLGNWYKKGSWGFVFPKLKGLGFFGKIGEIFKFIFFVILAIFLFWLAFKILMLGCTLCAGASPCIEILLRTLYHFGKLVLKVLASLCACATGSPCWRMKGGRESDQKTAPAHLKMVVIPENGKKQITNQGKMYKSLEPPLALPALDDSRNKIQEKEKSKKDKKPPMPPPPLETEKLLKDDKKSKKEKKEKSKSKKDKKSKNEELLTSTDELESQPKSKKTKKSKKKTKKEKKSKHVDPTTSTDEDESQIKESAKKSKEKKKSKKEKKADKKTKKSKKGKGEEEPLLQPKSMKDDKLVSFEGKSDGSSSPPKRERAKGKDKNSRRQRSGNDGRSDDSSDRLRGGQSNPEWSTYWKLDSPSEDDCDGKTSWKTFYDF